jgi:hypothetical protein
MSNIISLIHLTDFSPYYPILSAAIASLITIIGNSYRENKRFAKQKESMSAYVEQKNKDYTTRHINEEMKLILDASASYREEIRQDMDKLKKEITASKNLSESQMMEMKKSYEKEIVLLRKKIEELTKLVEQYKQENTLLQKIISEENVNIPEWAINLWKDSKEKI